MTTCAMLGGEIPVSGFAAIGRLAPRSAPRSCVRSVTSAVLMQNHGVFTIGDSPRQAAKMAVEVEEIARTVHLASLLGDPILLTQEQLALTGDLYLHLRPALARSTRRARTDQPKRPRRNVSFARLRRQVPDRVPHFEWLVDHRVPARSCRAAPIATICGAHGARCSAGRPHLQKVATARWPLPQRVGLHRAGEPQENTASRSHRPSRR